MTERWLSEIEAIERDARAVIGDLTPELANRQPQPGRWSVAQNLDHTARTAVPYLERIEECLARNGRRRVRSGWLAALLARSMEPPPRMRVKTFRTLEPEGAIDPDRALADFIATHQRLATLIRTHDTNAFQTARFRSPFMPLIEARLDQGVDTLLAHARRHLWQARQARRSIGVPG